MKIGLTSRKIFKEANVANINTEKVSQIFKSFSKEHENNQTSTAYVKIIEKCVNWAKRCMKKTNFTIVIFSHRFDNFHSDFARVSDK